MRLIVVLIFFVIPLTASAVCKVTFIDNPVAEKESLEMTRLIRAMLLQQEVYKTESDINSSLRSVGERANSKNANKIKRFIKDTQRMSPEKRIEKLIEEYGVERGLATLFLITIDSRTHSEIFGDGMRGIVRYMAPESTVVQPKQKVAKAKAKEPPAKEEDVFKELDELLNSDPLEYVEFTGKVYVRKLKSVSELERTLLREEVIPVIKRFNRHYLKKGRTDETVPFIKSLTSATKKFIKENKVTDKDIDAEAYVEQIGKLGLTNSDIRNSAHSNWGSTPTSRIFLALHHSITAVNSRLNVKFDTTLILMHRLMFVEFLDTLYKGKEINSKFDGKLLED